MLKVLYKIETVLNLCTHYFHNTLCFLGMNVSRIKRITLCDFHKTRTLRVLTFPDLHFSLTKMQVGISFLQN